MQYILFYIVYCIFVISLHVKRIWSFFMEKALYKFLSIIIIIIIIINSIIIIVIIIITIAYISKQDISWRRGLITSQTLSC